MTAKRLIDNGKWVLWIVGFLSSAVLTIAVLWGRSASCAIDDNRKGITELREWKGEAKAKIEYTADGVRRLEDKWGTYVPPAAKK